MILIEFKKGIIYG